jgi:hypothetical protein
MNTFKTRYLNAALVAASLSLVAFTPVHAQQDSSAAPALTQQEIWQRAKFPWLYPTAPAQSNSDSAPALSQQEIWKRAKFPWLYPTSATSTGPVGYYPAPGTSEWFRCYKLNDCRKP